VHEAYLRLVDTDKAQQLNSRGHFFAACGEAMRRILVEQARRKQADKRGGRQRVSRADADIGHTPPDEEVLAIDDPLSLLVVEDPQAARLIQLRYFAGLSVEDASEAIGIARSSSTKTAPSA
jgi:RNA polymerase sigma factor (TIGR02999 family)